MPDLFSWTRCTIGCQIQLPPGWMPLYGRCLPCRWYGSEALWVWIGESQALLCLLEGKWSGVDHPIQNLSQRWPVWRTHWGSCKLGQRCCLGGMKLYGSKPTRVEASLLEQKILPVFPYLTNPYITRFSQRYLYVISAARPTYLFSRFLIPPIVKFWREGLVDRLAWAECFRGRETWF